MEGHTQAWACAGSDRKGWQSLLKAAKFRRPYYRVRIFKAFELCQCVPVHTKHLHRGLVRLGEQ